MNPSFERENFTNRYLNRLYHNRWNVLYHLTLIFITIRTWFAVVASSNIIYIAIMAISTVCLFGFYLHCRRAYEVTAPQDNDEIIRRFGVTASSMDAVLAIQTSLRATQTARASAEIQPRDISKLITTLPRIVYQPSYRCLCDEQRRDLLSVSTCIEANCPPTAISDSERNDKERGPSEECGSVTLLSAVDQQESRPQCIVCLEQFSSGDIITFLPCACGHQYHHTCIIAWLKVKVTCPLCTQSMVSFLQDPPPPPSSDV